MPRVPSRRARLAGRLLLVVILAAVGWLLLYVTSPASPLLLGLAEIAAAMGGVGIAILLARLSKRGRKGQMGQSPLEATSTR